MKRHETALSSGGTILRIEDLACPKCETPLQSGRESLTCSRCNQSWPIEAGVPHFVQQFPYWGEIPLEQMEEVNRRAEAGSWKSALLDFDDPDVQRASSMILNLDRANWQWLANLPPDSRVLDIGAGMGANSHALALEYREVVALEPVLERTRFMQQRFSQEGLSNVKIVRGSVWDLPFGPESFDLVAMNGVLEWVAQSKTGDAGEVQQQALRKMQRLLCPGGYIYIGIENRAMFQYLIGYLDPHCRLPFITILPRPLANWYAKRHGQSQGYRNYLYSSRGYRQLLEKTGFTDVEIYVAMPSYNDPRFLVPLKSNVFSYYSQAFNPVRGLSVRNLVRKMLLASGVYQQFQYSFAILARKATP
ncbi:MAG: methyltransferase domain-containing protein [Candidatus Solibacter usitatus]|nr:methyltransferase domain-containing protein [Candidatus Solibacter usitatus]